MLEGYVVDLLVSPQKNSGGLSGMIVLRSVRRQEQSGSRAAVRSDDALITFIQDFDNYLTASLLRENGKRPDRCGSATPKATASLRLTAN